MGCLNLQPLQALRLDGMWLQRPKKSAFWAKTWKGT